MKRIVLYCFAPICVIGMVLFLFSSTKKDVITLGATFPLTGEVASYGLNAQKGIQLAVDDINTQGGILGKNVYVDFQDDRHDQKEAVSNVTKLATIDKVPVIFGSAGSSVTLAVAPVAGRHKVILFSPISSSAKLSEEGGPFFFRTCPADDQQAEILAGWVYDSGSRNVAVIYTNNSWGKPLVDGFEAIFTKKGGKVLLKEGVAEKSTDFRTIIAKLKNLKDLDAVVSPTYPKEGGNFVRQAKELGLNKTLFGGDNWGAPEFREIAGNAADGIFYTAPLKNSTPEFEDFAKRFKTKYGKEPDIFAAYAYDAAVAVFNAIKASGSLEPEKIRDALYKISFEGVSGKVSFKPNGDLAARAFGRMTVKNDKAIAIK